MGFQNIGKFAASIANKAEVVTAFAGGAVDATMTQVATKSDAIGDVVARKASSGVTKLSGNALFNENIQGAGRKIAHGINNNSSRIGQAIGGGTEGMILGASTGAIVGGVSGGIDEDETFLGGAAKGALSGVALGGAIGTASGALHRNASLFANANGDIQAVASKISKWRTKDGTGIIADNLNTTGTTYSM